MKKLVVLSGLLLIGVIGWRIGENLSSDAVSMAVGIFFGILAGIPTALLVLASDRRRAEQTNVSRRAPHHPTAYPYPQQQPPVIVLNGSGQALPPQHGHYQGYVPPNGYGMEVPSWPQGQKPPRQFRVVGEQETWLEE